MHIYIYLYIYIYIFIIVDTCADVGMRVCLNVVFFGYLKVSLHIVSGDATLLLIIG